MGRVLQVFGVGKNRQPFVAYRMGMSYLRRIWTCESEAVRLDMGTKTKDQIYRGRNLATILAAVRFKGDGGKAGWYRDGGDWPVVWMELDEGQVGVHIRPEGTILLEQSILPNKEPPGGYDGHTRAERLNRMTEHIVNHHG